MRSQEGRINPYFLIFLSDYRMSEVVGVADDAEADLRDTRALAGPAPAKGDLLFVYHPSTSDFHPPPERHHNTLPPQPL